jgi:hypothetical protein
LTFCQPVTDRQPSGRRAGTLVELQHAAARASPPSQGVSSGPNMTAFHFMMLSGFGEPLAPSGGSD